MRGRLQMNAIDISPFIIRKKEEKDGIYKLLENIQ